MITKSIPNMFTIANLFLGILAIILVFDARPDLAALMVLIAMLTDGLDGRLARALNAQSEFGKELDSLSDVVSFGVAPAMIMYVVAFGDMNASSWIATAIFPICGALRLARFNVVSGTPGYFIGLPIPAAGGMLSTLALFHTEFKPIFLMIIMLFLSFLMVSNIKYPNFKKLGISKRVILIGAALLIAVAAITYIFDWGRYTRYLLVPLALYALYGMNKTFGVWIRRRSRKRNKKGEDPVENEA